MLICDCKLESPEILADTSLSILIPSAESAPIRAEISVLILPRSTLSALIRAEISEFIFDCNDKSATTRLFASLETAIDLVEISVVNDPCNDRPSARLVADSS